MNEEKSQNNRVRIILHLDLDAFFASCEEVRKQELRGRPVVIGADPKDGKGRGVVSTCNYEARKFGIHSAMPISWAFRACPHAIFLPVDMRYYMETSVRIMQQAREKFPECKFELASIDEVTFDVSTFGFDGAEKLAREFKKELKKKEGLTCSIGLGPNALVAKIASDFQKPDGLTPVKPHEVKMFLYPLHVRKLPGVGPKMEEALKALGVETIGQIQNYDKAKLAKVFGKNGEYLHLEAQGKSDREIGGEWKGKGISRQATFEEDTSSQERILAALDALVEEVLEDARESKTRFKTIIVKVRYENFETHTRQKKFRSPVLEKDAKIWARELMKGFLKIGRGVRLIGFGVGGLEEEKNK